MRIASRKNKKFEAENSAVQKTIWCFVDIFIVIEIYKFYRKFVSKSENGKYEK